MTPPRLYEMVCDPASTHEHPSGTCFAPFRGTPPHAPTLALIERKIRALHHYGDPPDSRLQGRVDGDVADIMDDVRLLVASPAAPPPEWSLECFLGLVKDEVARATAKYPNEDILVRIAALTGEVGELAEGVLKQEPPHDLYREAIQVAACAYRAAHTLARLERAGSPQTPEPR